MTTAVATQDHIIIHGDALQELPELEADSIQCCITSAPYWKSNQPYEGLGTSPSWVEYQLDMLQVFKEIKRVLKADGYFWLVTGYGSAAFKPGLQWVLASAVDKIGFRLTKEIIWDKAGSQNSTFDYIFCFHKYNNQRPLLEIAKDGFEKEIWAEVEYLDTDANWATIPDRFLESMIYTSSKSGDIILDPFAGSGTTAKIAKELDRKSISIEIEKTLIPLIKKNINE